MNIFGYLLLFVLFLICTPNVFFQVPYAWRNFDKKMVTIIHGIIFAGLWYIIYDTQIINVLMKPFQENKPKPETPVQRMELGPTIKEFTHRLGDGSK